MTGRMSASSNQTAGQQAYKQGTGAAQTFIYDVDACQPGSTIFCIWFRSKPWAFRVHVADCVG